MTADSRDILLDYYKSELSYLRKMGTSFARQYPKIAGRLELGIDQSPDPYVERILEGFSFLTARINYNLDREFPKISAALLNNLYPQFMNPIPAMSIARFEPDPNQGDPKLYAEIFRNTGLYAVAETHAGRQICRFRTCYPVKMWPVSVSKASLEPPDRFKFMVSDKIMENGTNFKPGSVATVLKIRIESHSGSFDEMNLNSLRFYINGERTLSNALYELLFCHVHAIAILPNADKNVEPEPVFLPKDAISPVGFSSDEAVLPYPDNAHPGYRLLHEYFTFPRKFLFFDINNLEKLKNHQSKSYFDILIFLEQMPARRTVVNKDTFCLGCTPIINLFKKTTDPIRMNGRRPRYHLTPDKRREKFTEIHSILSVSSSPDSEDRTDTVEPFFFFSHNTDHRDHKVFWYAERERTGRKDLPGTQMYLSFTDLDFTPHSPPYTTVYSHTLCTNRRLAEHVPEGAILHIEQNGQNVPPMARIHTLMRPTTPIDPPLYGRTLWPLISHLSLNYLSLGIEGEDRKGENLAALQSILKLYSFSERSSTYKQIGGISDMTCKNIVRRVGKDVLKGFCRGIEVSLKFDEDQYEGDSAFLLASVLNRFFPLYASINSFTQLVIKSEQREGIWKKWGPMTGEDFVF